MRQSKNSLPDKSIDFVEIKAFEHQLDDVMEVIDRSQLITKLKEVEEDFRTQASEINNVRLGIIYHEVALDFTFLAHSQFKGYAKKSFDILNGLTNSETTSVSLLPFIESYRASALSLLSAETGKLRFLRKAFNLFEEAIVKYSALSYAPEFLRGSVAENLPWFFFSKRKLARRDFQSIIDKQEKDNGYANSKIMSFTYWAWANQCQRKKFRKQALTYLDKAIELDPQYMAGRKRAEELKEKLLER
jgi:hypothetical protein